MKVDITRETFRQIVKRFGARGITQKTLAKKLGICVNYLSALMSGSRPISDGVRERVSAFFVENSLRELGILSDGNDAHQSSSPADDHDVNESARIPSKKELLACLDQEKITHEDVRGIVLYFRSRGVMRTTLAKKMGVSHTYLTAVYYRSKPVSSHLRDRFRAALQGRLPRINRLKETKAKPTAVIKLELCLI